ncbi:C-type lectin mannose-binding isoform-like [Mercenaria mercenaria]|uniref:C-type lectin mannose-binding isoform-like n=1 Tax=Mercenaria mercenaria TaxID=6596 RepID=UPI00234F8437|nr:C-type lectin mannose-binding isoform-like [Mercenaria mercenaria]
MSMYILNTLTILLVFGYNTSDAVECQDDWTTYGTSCYLFGHQSLSFYSAENYCRQHKGHLVHINGDAENTFIREHLRNMKGTGWWIGLTDDAVENTWIWYDTNEKTEYTDWAPNQPDNAGNNEDCVEFNMSSGYNGHWNDAPCHVNLLPICEQQFDNVDSGIVG